MEDQPRQRAGRGADGHVTSQRPRDVSPEVVQRGGDHRLGDAEELGHGARVGPVLGLLRVGQRRHEALVDDEARVDQRRVDPQAELGVHRVVGRPGWESTDRLRENPAHPGVHGVHPTHRRLSRTQVAEHERVAYVEGPAESPEAVPREGAVLGHARRHERVG
jgi:hypothetical protein